MEALSKIITMILVVILVFYFPLQYLSVHQKTLYSGYVEEEVERLVEDIRKDQCLSDKRYEEFLVKLNVTGELFDIEIEHAIPKSGMDEAGIGVQGVLVASTSNVLPESLRVSSEEENEITLYSNHSHTKDCYEGDGQDEQPICDQVVVSITATDPSQTVEKGSDIITTATAIYLDGHKAAVNCSSNFNPEKIGEQDVILNFNGRVENAKTIGTLTGQLHVTVEDVLSDLAGIEVTPSSYTVYNESKPTYTVKIMYKDGSKKTLTNEYTIYGWSDGPGIKNLNFQYREGPKTVSTNVVITVKPNPTGIRVEPAEQVVERYTDPNLIVTTIYEDGTTSPVTGYKIDGFDNSLIDTQTISISYTENKRTYKREAKITVTPMMRICPDCGSEYFLDEEDFDMGCPHCRSIVTEIMVSPSNLTMDKGIPLNILVTAIYKNGAASMVTDWSSNYNPNQIGDQIVTVSYKEFTKDIRVTVLSTRTCPVCGMVYSLNEDGTDPGCPTCKETLVSIKAAPEQQTIRQGEELKLTVTGTYQDGHQNVLKDWSTDFNTNKAGEQMVTVYYNNITCTLKVTVQTEHLIRCDVCGNEYDSFENPWGCPICENTATDIKAELLNGSNKIPYGKDLDLQVVITYRDDHQAILSDGWTDNFDPFQKGEQTITVQYKDLYGNSVSCNLNVIVVEGLEKHVCPNGHEYYADQENAECPYCNPVSDETLENYFECFYTDEILTKLYQDGTYRFNKGDYITVKVRFRNTDMPASGFFLRKTPPLPPISYGGEII